MDLTLINQSSKAMPRKWIQEVLKFVEKPLGLKKKTLSIVFLSRPQARRMNLQYRKRNYATDILSFAPTDPESWGELVICPEIVFRQARDNQHSQKAELAYLIIHGILHLLGHDHEGSGSQAQTRAKKMYRIQDQLFDRLRDSFDL